MLSLRLDSGLQIGTHTGHVRISHVCTYIYIYIYDVMNICACIYIYVCAYMYITIYILYIYRCTMPSTYACACLSAFPALSPQNMSAHTYTHICLCIDNLDLHCILFGTAPEVRP